MADKNQQIAKDVMAAVGGAENIISVTHCATRLRMSLKDESIPKDEKVQNIDGVLTVIPSGEPYQVEIGQKVPKVYAALCSEGRFENQAASEKPEDGPKEKMTAKRLGSIILNYLSGSMTPMIPAMITAAMFKTLYVLLGDTMGLISNTGNFYVMCDFMYDTFFYFLPIFLGFTTAKKLDINPVMGIFVGASLLVPDFMQLAVDGAAFSVYGIPARAADYSQTVLPIVLIMPVFAVLYKFFQKHLPDTLSTLFVPFLSMLIVLPFEYCLLAPIGGVLGDYVGNGILALGSSVGFIAVAIIGATWSFLVMTGMHHVLIVFGISMIAQNGVDI